MKNEAKMDEVRKAVTNYDISDKKERKFLFSCVFRELRSGKAVLPQADSHPRRDQHCCGLRLLERRLVASRSTVIIPFDDRVIFVSFLNCAQFSTRLSEVAQALNAVSGIQFFAGGGGLGQRWLFRTVCVSRRARI
jgi:hypothetical protein